MRTIQLKKPFSTTTIKIYDSIKELPIDRYTEFQKLLLQDDGIGSDMNAIASHFSKFHQFLLAEKYEEANQEAKNLHNSFFYIVNGINVKSFCFASLIHSINGKELVDLSQENIEKTLKQLSNLGLTQGHVTDITEEVKKNFIPNFEPTFLIGIPMKG